MPRTATRSIPAQARPAATERGAVGQGAATLERGLYILDAFTESDAAMTLADLARKTGIYKSTLLRLLSSLQKFGYVEHHADGSYRIGHKGLVLARSFQNSIQPAEVINGVLQTLVAASSESAAFHVRRGDIRICLYRVNSPQRVQVNDTIGDTWALGTGAAGKVLAAFAPDLRGTQELQQIRERLYAISIGETDTHAAGIAAPVFNSAGRCEGAITLTGPMTRFTSVPIAGLLIMILQAAADLTLRFGGNATNLDAAHKALLAEGKPARARTSAAKTVKPRATRTAPRRVTKSATRGAA